MSLQVAVDHENLVAAWVRAGSLFHLLVMLFYVLLKEPLGKKIHLYSKGEQKRNQSQCPGDPGGTAFI